MTAIQFLAEWALRSSALIASGALLLWALRVKDASIRWAAWTAVLCASLAIPALTAALPKLPLAVMREAPAQVETRLEAPRIVSDSPLPSARAVPRPNVQVDRPSTGVSESSDGARVVSRPDFRVGRPVAVVSKPFNWARAAVVTYALVALALLLRLCLGLAMSLRLSRGSRPTGEATEGIEIRESDRVATPVALGIVRSAVVLPSDWRKWDAAKLEAVLAHERSHIRRHDPAVQLLSAIHRALLWHSPLGWFLHQRIVRTAEEASDDAAMAVSQDRAFYAEVLLEFMQRGVRGPDWQGVPMARYGRADKRIHRILDGTVLSRGVTRWSLVAILTMGLPLAYVVAAANPQSAPLPLERTAQIAALRAEMARLRSGTQPRLNDTPPVPPGQNFGEVAAIAPPADSLIAPQIVAQSTPQNLADLSTGVVTRAGAGEPVRNVIVQARPESSNPAPSDAEFPQVLPKLSQAQTPGQEVAIAQASSRMGPRNLSEAEATLQAGRLTVWVPKAFVRGLPSLPSERRYHDYRWEALKTEFKADFPNFDLRFRELDRDEFIRVMHSPPQEVHFPDVAFVDNMGELRPFLKDDAVIKMWGRSRFESAGWWVVFRQATNFAAGEAFMLWLAQPLKWQSWGVRTNSIGPEEAADAQALAQRAVQDFANADAQSLESIMDPAASRFQDFGPDRTQKLMSLEPLLTFGNSRLAFVLVAAVGQGESTFGMTHSGAVLRNTGAGWKVLLLLPNVTLPQLESWFKLFDNLGLEEAGAQPVPVVTLLAPPDHAQLVLLPRPTIEWEKGDAQLAAYVVEWQFNQPGREFWSTSGILLVPLSTNDSLMRMDAPFGVGLQPHRWRVWAISKAGVVSTSEWRIIDFTPAQAAGQKPSGIPALPPEDQKAHVGADVVRPDDLLQIFVTDLPEVSREYRVSPGGFLILPLLREPIPAGDKTLDQISHLIATKLHNAGILADARVTVQRHHAEAREVKSQVYILGAVQKPGAYPLLQGEKLTIAKALAQAGGLSRTSTQPVRISVLRKTGNGAPTSIPVGFQKVRAGQDVGVELVAGDILFVPDKGPGSQHNLNNYDPPINDPPAGQNPEPSKAQSENVKPGLFFKPLGSSGVNSEHWGLGRGANPGFSNGDLLALQQQQIPALGEEQSRASVPGLNLPPAPNFAWNGQTAPVPNLKTTHPFDVQAGQKADAGIPKMLSALPPPPQMHLRQGSVCSVPLLRMQVDPSIAFVVDIDPAMAVKPPAPSCDEGASVRKPGFTMVLLPNRR